MLHWMPRILGIAFAIFLGMFALDVVTDHVSFIEIVGHLTPALMILAAVWVGWRWQRAGAAIYAAAGIAYLIWVTSLPGAPTMVTRLSWAAVIAGPAFLIAVLLLADSARRPLAH